MCILYNGFNKISMSYLRSPLFLFKKKVANVCYAKVGLGGEWAIGTWEVWVMAHSSHVSMAHSFHNGPLVQYYYFVTS